MNVAIHQPNYLPYIGFFDKMKKSDIFVIYDDSQFNKSDFQHRNKIRIYQGWKWLTVPVVEKCAPIKDIKIKNEVTKKGLKWNEVHLNQIRDNYKNAPCYNKYYKHLENIYKDEYENLIDLNMRIISFLKEAFDIRCKIIYSNEFGFTSKSTTKLIEITETLNGDTYLSGPGGRNYLDVSHFEEKGITVEYQEFKHPIYKQQYKGFVPNMSAIDLLFNVSDF